MPRHLKAITGGQPSRTDVDAVECHRCEARDGVASWGAVTYCKPVRDRQGNTRPGTQMLVCARCLAAGEITPLTVEDV